MPLTRGLLIATAVSFVLHAVVQVWLHAPWGAQLALATGGLSPWTALQVLTHPLAWVIVPGSPLVLFGQLLFLWLSLTQFEERYGLKATAQLLALATVASGALAALAGLVSAPDLVLGTSTWVWAGWAALGWSLRYATLDFFGIPLRGEAYLWFALGMVGLGFLTDPRVPTLMAQLGAIGAGVGFVSFRRRRLPAARVSSVVSINAARKARDKKNKEWLN